MTLPWDDGTTAGYDLLASHGPFTESFAMWTSMKSEGLESVGELGSSRTITTKWGVEPYVDHGSPLCN